MRTTRNRIAGILFVVLTAGVSRGTTTWKIDASHSKVLFTVTHMVINEVNGWFADFEGSVQQPGDADFTGSTAEIKIKTASISTGNEGRDKHLRNEDFFDAEKYPITTYSVTRFKRVMDNEYDITGNLTLHGVTRPVQLLAHFNGTMKDNRGNMHAGFKATGSINRYDFDLKWNKTLEAGGVMVSDKVDLTMNIELVRQ